MDNITVTNNVDVQQTAIGRVARILASAAILCSAVHFWPFPDNKVWQILNLSNLALLVWCPVLAFALLRYRQTESIRSILPHTSIWAYLVIVFLSVAFAANPARGISFSIKLAFTFVAGFTLFSAGIRDAGSLRLFHNLIFAACAFSVLACLFGRLGLSTERFGFHDNPYKYGTYIGILVPLGASGFFFSKGGAKRLLASLLVILALLSAPSLGAASAILTGMLAALLAAKRSDIRLPVAASLVAGIGFAFLVNAPLRSDVKLTESDSADLRQRYIEWQAEINLLEERTIVGSGAGSVNDYRSNFYYQLPKLNTLASFDQNGWLTAAAETGILGLLCFCWLIAEYGKRTFRQRRKNRMTQFAVSNLAALAAACVANMFSSVNYNGVLIIFVLLLALISRTDVICAEDEQ